MHAERVPINLRAKRGLPEFSWFYGMPKQDNN